jgi:hypothetical protein
MQNIYFKDQKLINKLVWVLLTNQDTKSFIGSFSSAKEDFNDDAEEYILDFFFKDFNYNDCKVVYPLLLDNEYQKVIKNHQKAISTIIYGNPFIIRVNVNLTGKIHVKFIKEYAVDIKNEEFNFFIKRTIEHLNSQSKKIYNNLMNEYFSIVSK